jgi:Ca-activated chloride channel family protein
MRSWALVALCLLVTAGAASGQPVPDNGNRSESTVDGAESSKAGRPRSADPYVAYADGVYDQALQGFIDQQVERPEDPAVALNVGSTHYQMRNYAEADRAFSEGLLSDDPEIRAQAIYNLGNSAYRQGRLEEAVELYKAVLEIDPEDEDAKFNLEFVRNEIRRRHEEAQKRQEQQEQQQQQQSQEQPQDQQQQQDQQEQGDEGEQNQEEQQGDESSDEGNAQDSDQDGLPDRVEREGENPTDPENPDTDGDGVPDGAEDLNRSGGVDPGETDPNKVDSDEDGIPDGQEDAQQGQTDSSETASPEETGLSREEAERYLQALEEGRPRQRHPGPKRRGRPEKDW